MELTLNEQEELIKELVSKDRSNPEIYVMLKDMTLIFLYRKHACDYKEEYEDIAHTIATDMYMKIYAEHVTYNHYLGYLNSVYKRYIQKYREEISTSLSYEEIAGTALLNKTVIENPFSKINNKVYLEDINTIIDKLMSRFCKYDAWSCAFNNLKLSLILTILRGEETSFHLNAEQSAYLGLLISKFKEEVINAERL